MLDVLSAIVEVYFDSRCLPCRRELPALAEAARDETLAFTIIVLGDEAEARALLTEISPALADRAKSGGGGDLRAALRAAGDEESVLPYARSLTSDGRVCGKWRGILSAERLRALLAACR